MALTPTQQNAVNDIQTHIKFFPKFEEDLGALLGANDVAGLQALFSRDDFKSSLSKRGTKLATKFNAAFTAPKEKEEQTVSSEPKENDESSKKEVVSTVPKAPKTIVAGKGPPKTSTTKESLMLKKIIRHLMQFEK
jgi:hypothetical protein